MDMYLMSIAGYAEMNEKSREQKKTLLHKFYLLHQLVLHGYDQAAVGCDDRDIRFLNQIRNLDFYTLKFSIESELYAING